jgi:hypothetical protein
MATGVLGSVMRLYAASIAYRWISAWRALVQDQTLQRLKACIVLPSEPEVRCLRRCLERERQRGRRHLYLALMCVCPSMQSISPHWLCRLKREDEERTSGVA